MSMATKLGRMMTYLDGFIVLKDYSHDFLRFLIVPDIFFIVVWSWK